MTGRLSLSGEQAALRAAGAVDVKASAGSWADRNWIGRPDWMLRLV